MRYCHAYLLLFFFFGNQTYLKMNILASCATVYIYAYIKKIAANTLACLIIIKKNYTIRVSIVVLFGNMSR